MTFEVKYLNSPRRYQLNFTIYAGDQEIVRSPSCDKEQKKQREGCEYHDSLIENRLSESLKQVMNCFTSLWIL